MHEPLWTALINGVKTRTTFGLDDGPVAKTGNPRLILICMRAIRVSRLFTLIDTPFTFVESLLRAGSFSILSISIVFARRMRFRGEEETSFFGHPVRISLVGAEGRERPLSFPRVSAIRIPDSGSSSAGNFSTPNRKRSKTSSWTRFLEESSPNEKFFPLERKNSSRKDAKILEISLLPRFVSVFFLGEIALSNLSILC